MNHLNIALLQLIPGKNLEENLQKGLAFCQKAKALGAVLLPSSVHWHPQKYRILTEEDIREPFIRSDYRK